MNINELSNAGIDNHIVFVNNGCYVGLIPLFLAVKMS